MANQYKIKSLLLILLLVGICLSMGCALGVTRVAINHDPLNRIENKKEGNILVDQFKDVRPRAKEYIGNKRNMYGMVLGHIGTEQGVSLTEIITKYFAEALREAGYSVVVKKESRAAEELQQTNFDAVMEGEITEFWMDLYMAVWHKVGVKLTVMNPDSKETLWTKVIDGAETNALWVGVTAEYEKVIRQALTKALNKAASEFVSEEFYKVVKLEKPQPGKELPKEKEDLEFDRQRLGEEKQRLTATFPSIPLPDYKISPPPSNVPTEIKALLGRWQGFWWGGAPAVLVVEKVSPEEKKAECIWAWGAWGRDKDRKPGFTRVSAELIPGSKPEIKFSRRMNFNFVLVGKVIHGTREFRGTINTIIMEKVE